MRLLPRSDANPYNAAIVVFSGKTDLLLLRPLRPGFRHCFALVRSNAQWLLVDPMAHNLAILPLPDNRQADLVTAYRRLGFRVVAVTPRPIEARPAPWRPFTCVEALKRLLGVRLPLVLTPRQFHRALKKLGNFS